MIRKVSVWCLMTALIICMAGCGSADKENSIVGEWSWSEEDDVTVQFEEDGSMFFDYDGYGMMDGEYEIKNDKLIMKLTDPDDGKKGTLVFSNLKIKGDSFSMYSEHDESFVTGQRLD